MIRFLIFLLAAGFGDTRNPSNASLPICYVSRENLKKDFPGLHDPASGCGLWGYTQPLQRFSSHLVILHGQMGVWQNGLGQDE